MKKASLDHAAPFRCDKITPELSAAEVGLEQYASSTCCPNAGQRFHFGMANERCGHFDEDLSSHEHKDPVMKNRVLLFQFLSSLLLPVCLAQPRLPLVIPRIQTPIKFDGLVDDDAWQGVTPFRPIVYSPNTGEEPSERTEILMAYDDEYVYVGARFYDREPEKIQATSKKRDDMKASNDWFGVLLDTFKDNENAIALFTSPTGLRTDMLIFNDAQGDAPYNENWNTFWDAEAATTGDGWSAEIRIPVSSLRFQESEGRVIMGLIGMRFIARKNEYITFPAMKPEWGPWGSMKPSQAQEIVFEDLHTKTPVYITPYLLGGSGWSYDLDGADALYTRSVNPTREIGLDAKYGLTNNITLDLTLNTDFAQVEADDQQINLTRFDLFFPEKRMFFQERASTFEFGLDGDNRLFYSRRIGIQDGNLVRIYGGARLTGRVGPWDLGFLSMQTAAVQNRPTENFGVVRLRRQVLNPYSYVGGIVTNRIDADGQYNTAYGFDGLLRLFGDDYLTLNWAQTFQRGRRNLASSLDPTKLRMYWERRTLKGVAYQLSYARAGAEYDPGMGFELRKDYTHYAVKALYGWLPGQDSWLLRHNISVKAELFQRNADGVTESAEIDPAWELESNSGFYALLGPKFYYENVPEDFSLSDNAQVPRGSYRYSELHAYFFTPQVSSFYVEAEVNAGSFYDGKRTSIKISPQWNASASFEMGGTYEFNKVTFAGRNQEFTAHLAKVRVLAMFSTQFSAAAFVQYNTATNTVTTNVRVRYNPREGNDLYLVYDEGLNTDRMRAIPALPYFSSRTVLVKYSYTFSL
jgi:hypothetical protein